MKIFEIEVTVTMSQSCWVRVPDEMSDEAVLNAITTALNADATIVDRAASESDATHDATHEVATDGTVTRIDGEFDFQWELEP